MEKTQKPQPMEKDRREKYLEDYSDVFTDIANHLVLKKELIRQEQLLPGPTDTIYKDEKGTGLKEQRRDCSKYVQNLNTVVCLLGLENQTKVDQDMAIRILGYDYGTYRGQISQGKERYGVISAVLYFGKNPWNAGNSLKERLQIPEELQEYVNDYKFCLIDVPRLTDKEVKTLTSDFRAVAEFFVNRRKPNYIPSRQELKHAEAVLHLLKTFTNDDRYAKIEEDIIQAALKGEAITMCEFAERMERQGIQKGIEKGIQKGIEKGIQKGIEKGSQNKLMELIQKKLMKGLSIEEIADALEEKPAYIEELVRQMEEERV